jgi:hypothetical protein
LSGFSDNLRATAASLGDPTKDSPEELENRYERVLSMTPLAIGGVLDDVKRADTVEMQNGEGGKSASKLEICDRVKTLLKDPQFTKVLLKAKSPRVRQSVYGLISHLSREHAVIFSSDIVEGLAPAILSSIGEKDHAIHSSMWGTLLSFTLAFPLAWKTIDIPKAFLPRLWSHIRHISPVSAEVGFSAILPLASVLPLDIVGKSSFFKSLLSSIWDSLANLAQESARKAAARAWQECFLFGMEQKNIDFEELFDVAFEPLVLHGAIVKGEQLARDVTYAVASALVKAKSPCLGAYENGISRAVTQALESALLCSDRDSLQNVRLLVVRHKTGCQENLELIGGTELAEKCLALLLNRIFGNGNFINPEELGNENSVKLKVDAMLFAASLYKLIPPEAAQTRGREGWATSIRAPLQRDLPMVVSNAKHLVELLASETQSDSHFTAACDLLISMIASIDVRDASEMFFSAIDQIIKLPNSRLGGATRLVQSCVSYCATSKKSSLHDWCSAKLDNLCVQLCYNTVAMDSYTEEFITNVVMGDGETTSLLTEEGQEGLLRTLLEQVNPSKSCNDATDTWDGGSDSIIVMRLLFKLVLAPTLAKTSSLVDLQVSVLTFLYHLLLKEFVVDKSPSRLVEEGAFSEEEDEDVTIDSRGAGSQILDFWQRGREIASVLLQASDSSREGFLGGVVSTVSAYSLVPWYHATEERLAECLYVLWTVLSEAAEAPKVPEANAFTIGGTTRFQMMLLTKISAQPSLRRLWVPFGGLVGYEALLNLAEESDVVNEVITCLLENEQNMMVDSKESIVLYLAQNTHTYSATLATAYAEGRLGVVASLLQCGLLLHPPVTIDVPEKLVRIGAAKGPKVSQSDVSNLETAAESFLLDSILQESNVDRVVPVLAGAGKCIRYLSIPGLRKFSEYTLKACEKAIEKPESADTLRLVAACFPVDDCTAHESSHQKLSDTTKGLAKGTNVWYYHRNENRWENATIINVDYSAVPPSYSVAIKGGIRETERDRLSVDDPSLRSQSLRFSNYDYSKLVTEEEKSALIDVLKLGLSREDLLGIDVVLLAVAYGGRTCCRADWEMVLDFLRRSIESLVEQVSTCLEPIRDTVISQAENLAQTDFNSLGSAVDFFSLLSRRGILHSSTVNKEAVVSILEVAGKALKSIARLHGATLSSISNLYCHIVAASQTSPFMPLITWESTQAQFCTFVLDVYLLIGKVFAVIILSVSPLQSDPWWSGLGESSSMFAQLSEVVRSILIQADDSFMSNIMKRADGGGVHQVLEGLNGLDAVVAFTMSDSLESLFGTAHVMLFHHPKLLSYLVAVANQDGGSQETLQDDALELASKGDVQEAFEAVGMNRVLAVVASNPRHPRFLYAWSLIIGHVLKTTYPGVSKAHSGLISCIRETPVIVDKLFSRLLDRLNLSRALSSVKKKNGDVDASSLPSCFNVSGSFYDAMRDLKVEEASGQSSTFAAVLLRSKNM